MRWNQIRDGWPDREIHLFGAGVDSGTFDYFTEAIVGKADQSRGDYTSSEDDNVIVQGVSGDELRARLLRLRVLRGKQGQAQGRGDRRRERGQRCGRHPAVSDERRRRDRTIRCRRPIFIYPQVKSLDRAEVKNFVDFFLSEGNALVREVGYIPLTDKEYELVRPRFAARKTGSMYHGDPQAGVTLTERLSH